MQFKKIAQAAAPTTQLQTLIHDLAGPLTALTMTLPELQKSLRKNPKISTHLYLELCNAATADLQQKMETLRKYSDTGDRCKTVT